MYDIFQILLDKYNVTPYKVSKETGVSTVTLSNWKNGKYVPKQEKLQKIADYFGVTVNYLMTGTDKNGIPEDSLKKRSEKDLMKLFGITKDQYLSQEEFLIDGEKVSRKDIEFIFDTMESLIENVKKRNKDNI